MNVIIIDDEPVICSGLSELVSQYGKWQIEGVFNNAEEALENCDWDNVQAALVDIRMPGLNGLEMIHILRERGYDTSVIFITAYARFEYAKQAVQEKAVDYLLKPVSNEDLEKALNKAEETYRLKLKQQESPEYIAANLGYLRKEFLREVLFEERVIGRQELFRKEREYGLEGKQYVILEFVTTRLRTEIKEILKREYNGLRNGYLYGEEYFFVFVSIQENMEENPVIDILKQEELSIYCIEGKALTIKELPEVYQQMFLKIRNQLKKKGEVDETKADKTQEETIIKKEVSLPIQQVMDYIEKNLSKPLSLKSISSEVYLHPTYLSNLFRKQTGYTLVEYINLCRIKEAKRLLRTPQNKVCWVMERVGFVNSRYFSKVFKDITGETPTQYKQNAFLKNKQ